MKIRFLPCLLLAAWNFAQAADCTYPRAPANLPDGRTATQEEMVTGMKVVKDYNALVTSYLACLDEKMKSRKSRPSTPSATMPRSKSWKRMRLASMSRSGRSRPSPRKRPTRADFFTLPLAAA